MEYCPKTLEDWITKRNKFMSNNSVETVSTFTGESRAAESDTQIELKTNSWNGSNTDVVVKQYIDTEMKFDWESVVKIVDNIAIALAYIHDNDTVHGDLKPRNGTCLVFHLL